MAKTKLYSVDVRIYGTLYIKATSAARARTIANSMKGYGLEVGSTSNSDIEVWAARYDDPGMPGVSLSPAMTYKGPDADCLVERADD